MRAQCSSGRGWLVTSAATGVGLVLGVLYAWSVIKAGIPDSWGWSNADKALPYAAACLAFALTMVPAGRFQDRFGPRRATSACGVLVGLGCALAGLGGASLPCFVLGFGVVHGVGIAFGYAAITPAAMKWFPPQRTGLIAGIVVAGFGLAPVYIAPLASYLLRAFARRSAAGALEPGVSATLIAFGCAAAVLVVLLAQLVREPPPGFVSAAASPGAAGAASASVDVAWPAMLRAGQFWVLWIMFFCGAGAGLMFISVAQDLGRRSLGERAFLAVVAVAIGNASGRVGGGLLSDRIGRQPTMLIAFLLQAAAIGALYGISARGTAGWPATLLVVLLLGASYGANLSLFPAAAKDCFGLRGFGVNYGLLFSAWGAAGLVMPWLNGRIQDAMGTNELSFWLTIGMLLGAAALSLLSRRLGRPAAALRATSGPG